MDKTTIDRLAKKEKKRLRKQRCRNRWAKKKEEITRNNLSKSAFISEYRRRRTVIREFLRTCRDLGASIESINKDGILDRLILETKHSGTKFYGRD